MHIPETLHAEFQGDARAYRQSIGAQPLLIVAALLAVYIVLGVLYESLAHPLTIISTLPSAGLGALLALQIFQTDLSLIAFIGIILLIGIVKKNGIMLVDFALEGERKHGMTPDQAIFEACRERFRPIMMTTLAAFLGALPLVIETAPARELRHPLGITIVGGLLVSQADALHHAGDLPAARWLHRRLGQEPCAPGARPCQGYGAGVPVMGTMSQAAPRARERAGTHAIDLSFKDAGRTGPPCPGSGPKRNPTCAGPSPPA